LAQFWSLYSKIIIQMTPHLIRPHVQVVHFFTLRNYSLPTVLPSFVIATVVALTSIPHAVPRFFFEASVVHFTPCSLASRITSSVICRSASLATNNSSTLFCSIALIVCLVPIINRD